MMRNTHKLRFFQNFFAKNPSIRTFLNTLWRKCSLGSCSAKTWYQISILASEKIESCLTSSKIRHMSQNLRKKTRQQGHPANLGALKRSKSCFRSQLLIKSCFYLILWREMTSRNRICFDVSFSLYQNFFCFVQVKTVKV